MSKINKEKIIEVISPYGFKEIPCSMPKNDFQLFKRNVYFLIYDKWPKLFYFLRDKVSPIKFLEERPDGSLFFSIKENGSTLYEICIESHRLFGTQPHNRFSLSIFSNGRENLKDGIVKSYDNEDQLISNLDIQLQSVLELKSRKRDFLLDQLC